MQAHLQILQKQYRTEPFGPWHTRECYSWEYEAKANECLEHSKSSYDGCKWFLQQAKILQDRAEYIRQKSATQQATQPATQPVTQQATPPSQPIQSEQPEQPVQEQSNSENTAESTSKKTRKKSRRKKSITKKNCTINSSNVNISVLSIIRRQRTTSTSRDFTSRFSNSPVAFKHASLLTFQHVLFLTSQQYAFLFASRLASLLDYIRYAEDMEAIGQG